MSGHNTKITRFGYIIKKSSLKLAKLAEIKKELTVSPQRYGAFKKMGGGVKWPIYEENGNYLSVPKYFGLAKLGDPDINRIEETEFEKQKMRYLGKLRPRQEVIVDKAINVFERTRGGVIVAGCGLGKTNMAIYLACHYRLKTLFIVHKSFLRDQAKDRILSTTNVKSVGLIQGKVIDTDHPFVIGMIQSLTQKDYDLDLFKQFGMIIIDEVHHMGARNFSKFYQMVSAKYMLGITAEHTRPDGLYKIINWYMGPVIHREEQQPNDMVIVKRFHYQTMDSEHVKPKFINIGGQKEPDRSTMITNLTKIKSRNQFLKNLIVTLFDLGKNILFLTGRKDQVKLIYKRLEADETIQGSVGMYIGEMSDQERKKSSTKQIIIATYDMAQEGLDIESLNVVILATPKTSIKQSVGRILRKEVYEEHPMVLEIIDDNDVFKGQGNSRRKYYQTQEYRIQDIKITDGDAEDGYICWNDMKGIEIALKTIPEGDESVPEISMPAEKRRYVFDSDPED
jgi:superfamily II DNA or RNA helicase